MLKRISLFFFTLLAASIFAARGAEMPAIFQRASTGDGPTELSVGIWMIDITAIDSAQQTFTAEFGVSVRWKDPRLTHTGNGVARYPLEQVWHPRLAIANETNSVTRKFSEMVEVDADGTVTYRQLYAGAFVQPLRLHSFPFDRQTFHIQLVAIRYRPDEVQFIPDKNWVRDGVQNAGGIAPAITLPDWEIEKSETKPITYSLAPGLQFSGYEFQFTAARKVQNYLWKVIFPLVLIVMMSWSGFWIDPVNANSQINVAVTSMLTLIAYRFTVDTQLPRLPYMTRLDLFFLISTLLVFLSLIEVLITTILDNNQRKKQAQKIDRYCRIIFPAVFLAASMVIFIPARN